MIKPKEIIRSNRKTIALIVNTDGGLTVRAPYVISNLEIMKYVEKKQNWIRKKSFAVNSFDSKHEKIFMNDGDEVIYLGDSYTLDICNITNIMVDGKKILVPNTENSREVLINWLKQQALVIFSERVAKNVKTIGVAPNSLKLSEAKTRWGSCSANNNINIAWRLIMCPISVIDYVVVHELSHITYKNHSKEFWIRVRTVLPNYRDQQDWLKANGKLMEII